MKWRRRTSPDTCALPKRYRSFVANSVPEPRRWMLLSDRKSFASLCKRFWSAVIRFEFDTPFQSWTPGQQDTILQRHQPVPAEGQDLEVTFCVWGVLRRLRGIFLMGAATPPCPGRGLRLSLKLFSMSPCPAKDVGHGKPCKWKMTTPSKVASPHFLDGAATTPPVPGGESVVTPPVSSNPNLNLRHPCNPRLFLI